MGAICSYLVGTEEKQKGKVVRGMTSYERVLVIVFLIFSLGLVILLQMFNWGMLP